MKTQRPQDPIDNPRPFMIDLTVRCPVCSLALKNMGDGTLLHPWPRVTCEYAGNRFSAPTIQLQKIKE